MFRDTDCLFSPTCEVHLHLSMQIFFHCVMQSGINHSLKGESVSNVRLCVVLRAACANPANFAETTNPIVKDHDTLNSISNHAYYYTLVL